MVVNENNPKIWASLTAPNPDDVTYWVDLTADSHGNIIKFYDENDEKWYNLTSPTSDYAVYPYIGPNGNWFIENKDSGVSASGEMPDATINGYHISENPVLTKEDIGLGNVANLAPEDYPVQDAVYGLIDGKVDKTRTINGYTLGADVVITKSDIGLGNVENVAPADMPISTATATALSGKVDTTRNIIAGSGLVGGGNLTADRTFNIASANDGIIVNVDNIQLNTVDNLSSTSVTQPLSANQGKILNETKVPTSRTVNGYSLSSNVSLTKSDIGLSNVSNLAPADLPISTATQTALNSKVNTSRQVIAGSGLTGGGSLTSDLTLNVVSGNDGITSSADAITLNTVNNLTSTSVTQPLSAAQGKVLQDGKINNNGTNSNIDVLHFNPTTLTALSNIGDVRFSDESKTLEVKVSDTVSIQLGQETQARVKNNAGVQINNGQVVYIESASGANPLAKLATTADPDIAQRTFGMATENIAINGFGAITTEGLVRDVNTSAFAEGAMLWLSTNGSVTTTEPVAPTPKVSVGMVLRSNAVNGVIYVKIRAIARNSKLSDVYAPTLANGNILRWNSTTSRFEVWDSITALANKVDVVAGKGLSTNDYTTTEKNKLAGIAENANNYVHPSTHSADILVDGTTNKVFTATEKTKLSGIATGAEVNVQSDWNAVSGDALILNKPTTISGYGITDAYTKTEVDNKLSAVYKYKGVVSTVGNLPSTGMVLGDVWNVTDTNINYAWDGSAWDPLGGTVGADVSLATPTLDGLLSASDFVKLSGIEANANKYIHPATHSADIIVDGTTNKVYTATEKTKLAGIAAGAEVNVNSDWNAASGDAQILNKPTTISGYGITDAYTKTQVDTSLSGKEATITAGTTSQYWRGDKSWQTLNKAAVGLSSVENTALSTWVGSTNISTVGTITNGTWSGSTIGISKGGTNLTALGTANQLLRVNSGASALEYFTPTWTSNTGTVTSVSMTVPTGLTVTGSPVTTAGTFAITLTSGYSIPTTVKQGQWDTAYGWGNHSGLYQPIDADLTAIAALSGTSGLLKKTGVDTWTLDTTSYATTSALDGKVDKIIGKGLSTEDFTAELLTKLNGISEGAEVNVQSDWLSTEGDSLILNKPYVSDIEKRTINGSLSSASYFKFAETPINPRGYMGHFRITVDSTTTTIGQILDVWVMSSGENAPLVWAMSNTKSTTAATTGVYNIRCIYPKTLDNGYNAQFELAANNTTARTIKIELISSSNVTLLSNLVASAPNATYQTTGSAVVVGYDGFVVGGTIYGSVSGSASSTNLLTSPYTAYTAGAALVSNDIIALGTDLKWYKVSNAGVTIPLGTLFASCGSTYALSATVATSYVYGNRTLQTGTTGTKNVSKDLYVRGTIDGQNLVTDGTLTTELEAGYSYIRIGSLTTATTIFFDGNNRLLTMDADGLLSKLDGYMFGASKVNGFTVEKNVPSDAVFTDTISDWNAITGNAVILNKPTTLLGYGITDAQEKSNDLTAIAALAGTSGLLKKTAADTWALDTSTYLTSITKTMVESVLTGDISSHTHSQYLTSITKSQVETVLTGEITSHTHAYQPIDADLTSIAGLSGTSGFLKKTAANTWSLDTSTYLTGNQTITLSGAVIGSGTTAITTTYDAIVPTTKGGTGLSTIGSAGQVLTVNTGATGLEWTTLSGGGFDYTGFTDTYFPIYSSASGKFIKSQLFYDIYGLYVPGETHLYQGNYFDPVSATKATVKISLEAGSSNNESVFTAGLIGNAASGKNTYGAYFNNGSIVSGGGINYGIYVIGNTNVFTGTVSATSYTGAWNGDAITISKGGTGLTSIGTAGQYLAVNSGATALEWVTSRDKGVNTVTTLASLPITKRLVTATVTAATTISLASALAIGDELHIIVYNNSGSIITQTLPNTGSFKSLSGTSISIPAGGRVEINILCYATTSYLIRAL